MSPICFIPSMSPSDSWMLKRSSNAAIRDSVLWPGTEVAPQGVLIGAVAGTGPLPDKL